MVNVSVFCGCPKKLAHTGSLNNRHCSRPALEAGSLRSRCPQGRVSLAAPGKSPSSPLPPPSGGRAGISGHAPLLCASVFTWDLPRSLSPSSYEDTSHTGLRTHSSPIRAHFNLMNYICKDPNSKDHLELGLQLILWETQSNQDSTSLGCWES